MTATGPWWRVAQALTVMLVVGIAFFLMGWAGEISDARAAIGKRADTECAGSKQCTQNDLYAQVRSADAAETLVDLTFAQLVLALLGTIGLGGTLILTIVGTRAAVRAAKAAEDSVEVTRDASMRQSRAYLSILPGPVTMQDETHRFEVDLFLHNTGETPARKVGFTTALHIGPSLVTDEYKFPWHLLEPLRHHATIGAGENVIMPRIAPRVLTPEELAAITNPNSKWKVYVFGRVEYTDVFGMPHFIQFVRLVVLTERGPILFITPGHNDGD